MQAPPCLTCPSALLLSDGNHQRLAGRGREGHVSRVRELWVRQAQMVRSGLGRDRQRKRSRYAGVPADVCLAVW